jgi:6,7-dimethyl-8-ribityllumazine synthase
LIIEARYYTDISDMLLKGARKALDDTGVTHETLTVPGALEIPAALKFADIAKGYDAYVVLGCIIRGETTHYDIVCNESARGVYDLVMGKNLAVGNGILTVENDEQALARADMNRKNKGGEAAHAALRMLKIKKHFGI